MSNRCPFCGPNWAELDIVERVMPVGPVGSVAIIRPLNPVTDGHVLVIHRDHDESAAATFEASRRSALLMAVAAEYVGRNALDANIITSVGAAATQTVMHTHVHIVPRRPGDGLPLPWTPQQSAQEFAVRLEWKNPDRDIVLTDPADIKSARKGYVSDAEVVDVTRFVTPWEAVK